MKRFPWLLLILLLFGACQQTKSSNPLSPSVAGPIPGVTITAPRLLGPTSGQDISVREQPLTLLIENAATTGSRPLTYRFEIAADAGFATRLFTREGVPPGEGGRTTLRLADQLGADRTYYWRARAEDGANTGPFAEAAFFRVFTPVLIDPPVPVAPIGGTRIAERRPTFVVRAASRSGPVGALSYRFEIAGDEPFSNLIAVVTVPEQANETRVTLAQELDNDRAFFWRVWAYDTGGNQSPRSATQLFYTPVRSQPPPPPPPPTPGGPCGPPYPNTGEGVIACVERRYPERLAPTSTLGERQANMEFLRDRIIETGKCGGMDLGLNLKRGGPEISIDFIVHRTSTRDIGIDIGQAYDDYRSPLRLQWAEGPLPFYREYPMPRC